MTKLMKALSQKGGPIETYRSSSWYHLSFSSILPIVKAMTEDEANEFMLEVAEFASKTLKSVEDITFFNHFFSCEAAQGQLLKLVSDESINAFIDACLDNQDVNLGEAFVNIHRFENLELDTIMRILTYQPEMFKQNLDDDGDLIYHRRFFAFSNLIAHKNMTQEALESLIGERALECRFLNDLAEKVTRPDALLKCVMLASRDDGDYYTINAVIENPACSAEMLEKIAAISDKAAGEVINSNRCTKALRSKLAQTAKGEAASALLASAKTDPALYEKLVDANDNPEVLEHLSRNRSKKVPVAALLKAFAKIPDNMFYIKQRFLKRADVGHALSALARESTKCFPTWVAPKEESD